MENSPTDTGNSNSSNLKKIIWTVLVIILVGILIYVFWGKLNSGINTENGGGANIELTDAERDAILEQLESVDTPELTDAERDAILEQLESVDTPELTDAERDAILEQLSQ